MTEVSTVSQAAGARTIAGLVPRAAAEHGARVAVRFKRDGAWHDVTYAEVAAVVQEIGLGLVDLGLRPGDRICILATTRPEWSYVDMAATEAGLIVVPIYQTNSPEECAWVIADSGACAIVGEDEGQLAKVAAIRDRVPHLRTVVVVDPPGGGPPAGVLALDEVRRRGRTRPGAELEARSSAVRPEDPFTIIYTSGTTGPPKGCVLTHANYRASLEMAKERTPLDPDAGDVLYLYLPLAHAAGLLMQLIAFDLGVTIAYFGGDRDAILRELAEVRPTYFPSVPRTIEKIYTHVTAAVDPERLAAATRLGVRVRELQIAGEHVPEELERPFAEADASLFAGVRDVFGGRVRQAISGAAPIAKEILEFFFACGVPVMETYGMTETATAAAMSTPAEHRFGSVGKPLSQMRMRIAEDGELLIRGPNVFAGYHGRDGGDFGGVVDGWLHTGDLAAIDDDGYLYIVGRKKDLIITAGGKNITPANLENEMKQTRWVSQAVMLGDRRPYPVMLITLDEEEIMAWARTQGLDGDLPALARDPKVRALVGAELDRVNDGYAQAERVKRFTILPRDLSQAAGELTPTMKVRRSVVAELHRDVVDAMYDGREG